MRTHGALASESVVVSRAGRVRVTDLALAQGTAAAIVAGLVPPSGNVAPEIAAGGPPSGPADVYGVGALLYEALVGSSLERGGPRPSEVVANLSAQIDEIVARSCHRDPEKRFGRADVLGEVVAEALGKAGGAVQTGAVPKLASELPLGAQVKEVIPATQPLPAPGAQESLASSIASHAPGTSGNPAIDRALQAALADSTEKWLVAKGKLDYGPFPLAEIVRQIEKGEIVHGNIIMDKDTGARTKVETNPLLGPLVDAAKQKRDDARRAQAEVVEQGREKTKGVTLYAVIGLGVVGVAVAVIFIVKNVGHEETTKVAGVDRVAGATLDVKVSLPKAPPPHKRTGGGGGSHGGGGGGGFHNTGTENNSLDMSGDDDDDSGASSLDMGTVYKVYSGAGGQLGQCMMSNGASSANISIIIGGPTGRVNFVKVNGKASGGLQGCLGRVLSGLHFPTLKSGRTRAEFDINL